MTTNGWKPPPELGIPMSEKKDTTHSNTMSGPVVPVSGTADLLNLRRKHDMAHAILRLFCLSSSIVALSFMVTAEQAATLSIFGFNLSIYSKWSYSDSFEYLVGVSAAVAAYSLLQLILMVRKLMKKLLVIPSRNQAWIIFACDQILAYAMMSAGSAAAGVTNLNRAGIRHSSLPNFCKPLHSFCNHAVFSIAFGFFTSLLLAASVLIDVFWLSRCYPRDSCEELFPQQAEKMHRISLPNNVNTALPCMFGPALRHLKPLMGYVSAS